MKTFENISVLIDYVKRDERQYLDTKIVALWEEPATGDIKSCHIEYWYSTRSFHAIHARRSIHEVENTDLSACFLFVVLND